jgi:hypothetical protein
MENTFECRRGLPCPAVHRCRGGPCVITSSEGLRCGYECGTPWAVCWSCQWCCPAAGTATAARVRPSRRLRCRHRQREVSRVPVPAPVSESTVRSPGGRGRRAGEGGPAGVGPDRPARAYGSRVEGTETNADRWMETRTSNPARRRRRGSGPQLNPLRACGRGCAAVRFGPAHRLRNGRLRTEDRPPCLRTGPAAGCGVGACVVRGGWPRRPGGADARDPGTGAAA